MKNTTIDIPKLKHATPTFKGDEPVTIAQCPACAAAGHDLTGRNHLIIFPDGAFACALHTGEAGTEHRKEILDLVGVEEGSLPTAAAASPPLPKRQRKPRPLNRIPTKITYIKLKPRPQPPQDVKAMVVTQPDKDNL